MIEWKKKILASGFQMATVRFAADQNIAAKVVELKKEATQRDIYEVVNHLTSGFFGHMLKKQEELLRR